MSTSIIIAFDGKTHFKFNSLFILCLQQPELQESSMFCACFNAVQPIRLGMNSFVTNNRGDRNFPNKFDVDVRTIFVSRRFCQNGEDGIRLVRYQYNSTVLLSMRRTT